jgi:hypothetical protein
VKVEENGVGKGKTELEDRRERGRGKKRGKKEEGKKKSFKIYIKFFGGKFF